jgi:hypothetical protein
MGAKTPSFSGNNTSPDLVKLHPKSILPALYAEKMLIFSTLVPA